MVQNSPKVGKTHICGKVLVKHSVCWTGSRSAPGQALVRAILDGQSNGAK